MIAKGRPLAAETVQPLRQGAGTGPQTNAKDVAALPPRLLTRSGRRGRESPEGSVSQG